MNKISIGVVAGSARKESYSRKIAALVSALLPAPLEAVTLGIDALPLFNQDYDDEGRTPPEWSRFRNEVDALGGFLFVTPEYNRSLPPLLKNALDVASRPYGQNRWSGKPGAIIGVSPGKLGAFGAAAHLRQVLSFLNVLLLPQPEMYLSGAASLLDEAGNTANPETARFLGDFAAGFAAWVEKIHP